MADRVTNQWSDDPAGDLARAEKVANSALALQPDDASAHMAMAQVFFDKQQWRAAISQAEAALADDPNYADARANLGLWNVFLGHSENSFAGLETALRLSPRDPNMSLWQFYMCHPTRISPNGRKRSTGAANRSPAEWAHSYPLVDLPPPTLGPATTRRRKRPLSIAETISRVHRSNLGGHPLDRRPDLQRAIRAHRRGPPKGGAAGGGKKDELSWPALSAMSRCPSGLEPRRAAPCSRPSGGRRGSGSGCDARRLSTGRSIRA